MKSVMVSIKPQYCELIASGKKTIEVRKTRPKIETPFKVYIYATKLDIHSSPLLMLDRKLIQTHLGINDEWSCCENINGRVIGEFVCDEVFDYWCGYAGNRGDDCLSFNEQEDYLGEHGHGYGWHISDLKIYDYPKELGEFFPPITEKTMPPKSGLLNLKRPPQSWCYVEKRQ